MLVKTHLDAKKYTSLFFNIYIEANKNISTPPNEKQTKA